MSTNWRNRLKVGMLGTALLVLSTANYAAEPLKEAVPNMSEKAPTTLLTASLLGGAADDEIVSTAVTSAGTVLLAGNTPGMKLEGAAETVLGPVAVEKDATPPKDAKNWVNPNTYGFLVALTVDAKKLEDAKYTGGQKITTVKSFSHFSFGIATVKKISLDEKDNIYLLGNAPAEVELSNGVKGKGTFLLQLTPDGTKITKAIFKDGIGDYGFDSNGDIVLLVGGPAIVRLADDWKTEKWTAKWKAFGGNRPGGIAVDAKTGTTTVIGYGMTKTGFEPYKDPFGYGFDRDGKQLWMVWNPDPRWEASKDNYIKGGGTDPKGGNGLMADTTGKEAYVGLDGKVYFNYYSDGGNTVCMYDPQDVSLKMPKEVYAGVLQNGPGYGFHGASKTSVVFRIDALTGKVEKGTWLSAWKGGRAGYLNLSGVAEADKGTVLVTGASAEIGPIKLPWLNIEKSGNMGGNFLAIFDKDFKLLQAGTFPTATINAVATNKEYIVVAGSANIPPAPDPLKPDAVIEKASVYNPLQGDYAGGNDGYFAIFKVKPEPKVDPAVVAGK